MEGADDGEFCSEEVPKCSDVGGDQSWKHGLGSSHDRLAVPLFLPAAAVCTLAVGNFDQSCFLIDGN